MACCSEPSCISVITITIRLPEQLWGSSRFALLLEASLVIHAALFLQETVKSYMACLHLCYLAGLKFIIYKNTCIRKSKKKHKCTYSIPITVVFAVVLWYQNVGESVFIFIVFFNLCSQRFNIFISVWFCAVWLLNAITQLYKQLSMNALVLELHFKQPRKAERGSRTSSCLTRYFHLLPVGEFMTKPQFLHNGKTR